MTLKKSLAINISIGFSLLFGLSVMIIYLSFSSFRKEEFMDRLEEKALTSCKLLLEVKEVDKQLLQLIDQNSINKLYNEKTLIFDENFKLIYSSIDDASITWNTEDLKRLKTEEKFFTVHQEKDLLGIYYDFEETDYYVLIAAEDKYGNNKLNFLFYLLLFTFLAGTLLVWLFTYFVVKKLLHPLDYFQEKITNITVNELHSQLPENGQNDEINLLTKSFNQMLWRIEKSFNAQKEFTDNASHELRTPVSRITLQLENLLQQGNHPPATLAYLKNISNDVNQITDLINSLLLLAKMNIPNNSLPIVKERIDEVIFAAYEQLKKTHSNFQLNFEIIENEIIDNTLEIWAVKSLLQIVFVNLLKNACLYSDDHKAIITIEQPAINQIKISIANTGEALSNEEITQLFQPFMRGNNARKTKGSGLGLRIVKRILDYHNATISYQSILPDTHLFQIIFSI